MNLHTRTEFEFTLDMPYDRAAPFFGALEEQKWDPDWHPQFVHPTPGADQEGSVFLVNPQNQAVWITTQFDLPAGRVQYVNFLNRAIVIKIDIRLTRVDEGTAVHVVYERTAIEPGANETVRQLAKRTETYAAEWKSAIEKAAQPQ
jgi:thiamine pyrophosphate-dependent acetolactate synthase large subunit-like protein